MRRPRRTTFTLVFILLATSASLYSQSSVTELNEAGWKALQAGNAARASQLFGDALSMRPDEPVLLLGAGAASHALGRQQEAMARLKSALTRNPRLAEASRMLAAIAYEEGDTDLAIRTLEAALKLAPQDARLAKQLAALREEVDVHRSFEERRSDRFRVMFEGREVESLAADATAILSSAFWKIGEKIGAYPSDTVVAILYTEKQFRDITHAPEWSGGQYDGRIRIPVAGADQQQALFEHVLTHELTHAILANVAPRGLPTWLNEGLAQYFDGTDPNRARRRLAATGRRIPLTGLERGFGRFNAADAQIAYDESLLAVGAILDRPGFGWTRLFHELDGAASTERVLDSFGFSYADLEATFAR